jgi:glycosyltransferase involved in cell wall biosynthesis
MESLSVVIITHNEEKNIGRAIDEAKKIADEVIVFDSFSTDNTANIARQKGVIFHQHPFEGYGAQKNAAAATASFNHILYLDADEFCSDALIAAILREKQQNFPYDAYSMNRQNNYCGQWIRHGSWYPDKKIRLIDRTKGSWNNLLVHEHIEIEHSARLLHLNADLMHYAYGSISEHIQKNNRYSSLSAKLMYQQGKRTNRFKLWANPFWTFVHGFWIKLGFMDGLFGFIIAVNVAHLSFLKHAKLLGLQKLAAVGPEVGNNP